MSETPDVPMDDELETGDVYEGEPEDVERAVNGAQDDLED